MAAAILVVGTIAAADAVYTAAAAVLVALIGGVATVAAVIIQTNRGAKNKGEEAIEAVSGLEDAWHLLRDELDRCHERIDLVEEREGKCLESLEEQMNEILRLRAMVVGLGGSPERL